MGWLERIDRRNQRIVERDNARFAAEDDHDDDAVAAEAATWGSTFAPGLIGLIGLALATLLGLARHRERS